MGDGCHSAPRVAQQRNSPRRCIVILEGAEFQATIPATDINRARGFYEGTLGLKPERVMEAGVIYRFGSGTALFLFPGGTAGAGHTVGTWFVDDLPAAVEELRGLGVKFEEYDMPGLKTENGIADLGDEFAAWFKDSEGNILAVSHLK
jgi:catechol 2,3-dioxygenase-like lactoylglutathione lyase family enzyme